MSHNKQPDMSAFAGAEDTPEHQAYRRGFQAGLSFSAQEQRGDAEPYAHIVELPAGEYSGTAKYFTAPSDPRGRPVYLHPPTTPPAQASDAEDAQDRRNDETAWLVEYDGKFLAAIGATFPVEAIQYLCVRSAEYDSGELALHADVNKALRFARKEDAEAAKTLYAGHRHSGDKLWMGNYLHVREHMWPAIAAARKGEQP